MAYFPNGSSGDVLDAQCADCPLGYGWNDPNQKRLFDPEKQARPCPVALVQLMYNYDQVGIEKFEDAMNCLINKDGICRIREQLVEIRSVGDG
jgi:hypothetical protein